MTQTEIVALLQDMRIGTAAQLDNVDPRRDDEETMWVERNDDGFYGENGKWDWALSDADAAAAALHRWGYHILTWRGPA